MLWFGVMALAMPGWSCSCLGWPSAREAWDDSPLVFIGQVESVEMGDLQQIEGVRVEEAFKGVLAGQHVTLHQPVNSCSPNYKEGDRILFYLHPAKEANTWVVAACHRSRPVADAGDDLLFLHALPESLKRSRLSGEAELYEQSFDRGFHKQRALAGMRVTITGKSGAHEAITDADGVYEVYGLPAGDYKIEIKVPPKMKISFAIPFGRGNVAMGGGEIHLAANGGAGTSFVLMPDNQMSGRVLDPDGKPMKDVCVELEPARAQAGRYSRIFDCSNEDGRFVLDEMPPGPYHLVANKSGRQTGSEPFPPVYYPGDADKDKATIVTIADGEHLEHLDIRVPARARRIRISGRMQFHDGTPIQGESVSFVSAEGSYKENTDTEGDGSFQLTVVAGISGEVRGEIWVDEESAAKCPDFGARLNQRGLFAILSPPAVAVGGTNDQSGLVLMFPFASCAAWHNYGADIPAGK